jgi:hypothetical protein
LRQDSIEITYNIHVREKCDRRYLSVVEHLRRLSQRRERHSHHRTYSGSYEAMSFPEGFKWGSRREVRQTMGYLFNIIRYLCAFVRSRACVPLRTPLPSSRRASAAPS